MSDPIFPDGIRVFQPREGAPEFVKGALVIESLKFAAWLGQYPDKEVRLDIKLSRKGSWYLQVNTWGSREAVKDCPQPETPYKPAPTDPNDDIPF